MIIDIVMVLGGFAIVFEGDQKPVQQPDATSTEQTNWDWKTMSCTIGWIPTITWELVGEDENGKDNTGGEKTNPID